MADLEIGIENKADKGSTGFTRAVNKMIKSAEKLDKTMKELEKTTKKGAKATDEAGDAAKKGKKKLNALEKATNSMGKAWAVATKSIFNFKNAYITVAALFAAKAMVNFTKEIFNVGAAFEKMMVTVKKVSGATELQYSAMTMAARKYGATTEHTASQVADSMKFLAMAGLEVQEIMDSLGTTLNFATAANLGMGKAADISTNVMTSMGIEAASLERVHDTLISTTQSSNSSVEELGESFRYASGTANMMGMDIEFLSTLLGKLHDSGVKGSIAGTNLNQAFIKIAKNLPEFNRGTEGVLALLTKMNEEMWSIPKAIELFGIRGGRAMMLLANASEDSVKELTELYDKIKDGTGTTEEFSEAIRETAWGSLQVFKSALEEVKLEIFANKTGLMTDALNNMTDYLRENKDVLSGLGQQVIQTTVEVVPHLLKMAEEFIRIADAIKEVYKWYKKFDDFTKKINEFSESKYTSAGAGLENKITKFFAGRESKKIAAEIESYQKAFEDRSIMELSMEDIDTFIKTIDSLKEKYIDSLNTMSEKTFDFDEVMEEIFGKKPEELPDILTGLRPDGELAKADEVIQSVSDSFKGLKQELLDTFKDKMPMATKATNEYAQAMKKAEALGKEVVKFLQTDKFKLHPEGIKDFQVYLNKLFTDVVDKDKFAKAKKSIDAFSASLQSTAKSGRDLATSKVDVFFGKFGKFAKTIENPKIRKSLQGIIKEAEKLAKINVNNAFDVKNADKIIKIFEKASSYREKYKVGFGEEAEEILRINTHYDKLAEKIKKLGEEYSGLLKILGILRSGAIRDFKIHSFSKKFGETLAGSIRAGIEGGFDGALDYIKGVFANTLETTLSNAASNAMQDGLQNSAIASISPALGGLAGSLAGGLAGMWAGGMIGAVSGDSSKEKDRVARQQIEATKELVRVIKNNTAEIGRQLAANYEQTRWTENLVKLQTEMAEKLGSFKMNLEPGGIINRSYQEQFETQINVFYKSIGDAHEDFLTKYIEEEGTAYKKTLKELKRDADELAQGFVDVFVASGALPELEENWVSYWARMTDIVDKELLKQFGLVEGKDFEYVDGAGGGKAIEFIGGMTDVVEKFINAQKGKIEELKKIGPLLDDDTLGPWQKLKIVIDSGALSVEQMTEALGIQTDAWDAFIETMKKFEKERQTITDDVAFFMDDLKGNVTPLDHAIKDINDRFDTWVESMEDAGGKSNLLNFQRQEAIAVTTQLYDAEGELIDVEEKRLKQIEDFIGLAENIQDFNLQRSRRGFGISDWQNEIFKITERINALDENSESYNDKVYALMSDQFSATKELVALADQQLNAYLDAQKSIEDQMWELTGGSLSQTTSVSTWQSRFDDLFAKSQGGDLEALSDFQSFIPRWIEALSSAGFSAEDLAFQAAGALSGINTGLEGPINDFSAAAETSVTADIQSEPQVIHMHLHIDSKEIAYAISEQIDEGNIELLTSIKGIQ